MSTTTSSQKVTNSEEETVSLGRDFARSLSGGEVVALFGDLGSGKTRFVKGICAGLGVREHVTSPTFTILNEYKDGTIPVYHFDFYRLRTPNELNEIGFEEYVFGDGVCMVEWADIVEEKLPPQRYDVRLRLGETREQRIITIDRAE